MKKTIITLFFFFALLFTSFSFTHDADAQYYGYGYPAYGFFYSCLSGPYCSKSYRAATVTGLTINAVETAIAVNSYFSAREAQVRQAQYQAEAARSNPQQMRIDYYNMLRVAPFFDDATAQKTPDKNLPEIKSSLTKQSKD